MKGAGRLTVVFAAVLAAASLIPGSAAAQTGSVERPFVAGGQVRMDLSAGDYTIRAGSNDRVLVQWETRSADEAARVRVDIQRQGSGATITTNGPHNNFRVVIELPARTDVRVELSAGDLKIRGIEGSKDVGSWAGDIDIDVGHANDYATAEASVKVGDLTASAFNVSKSGLFRSFSWKGPGRYTLRVKLTAGDLRLHEALPR